MKKYFFFLILLIFAMNESFAQKTDVWDFGGQQLDTNLYNNQLDVAAINAWYTSPPFPGQANSANLMPSSFTAGILSWVGGTNDRLRTTNTAITRYDVNVASVASFNGRIYCNSTATPTTGLATLRYLNINLNEDDEVKVIVRGDAAGLVNFANVSNPSSQTDTKVTTTAAGEITEANFVAKYAGNYRIYDATAKASYYRIYRKAAVYSNVNGTIDTSLASSIPSGYSIVFTNPAGKSWTSTINSGTYNVNLPLGYQYTASLVNASGFIITSGDVVNLTTVTTPTFTNNMVIAQVSLYTVSGAITGLGSSISSLGLTFTPNPSSGSIYTPSPVVNATNATYSVQLEANVPYTISGQGVNDFQITANTLTIPAQNTTANIAFSPKTTYPITVNTTGLSSTQLASLQLTFTNINESGYVYNFSNLSSISLRNGTYKITSAGLDNFPVEQALTSNLTVNNAAISKAIAYKPVTVWSFDDKVINTTTSAYYKGMQLNGQITTVIASGHLTAKTGATLLVPVKPGEKVLISYYYTANFSIEGGTPITTASNSTTSIENTQYNYTGTVPGNVTITVGGTSTLTTYFTEIKVVPNIAYSPTITVGVGKDYTTINAALDAVTNMVRPNNERVTILIDAGNYEEMLVVSQPNVTLKNATAVPSTAIINGGVGIGSGAVRITSYYGHGYYYYSMGSNQKYSQELLDINKQNGNYSYQNTGAGTTNGSYWNATVVVSAAGFQADNIIIENSFNQYISPKEANDVVVAWATGSPGIRSTTSGNTTVQNKAFVERAAAIAFTSSADRAILNRCRIVGRQDSFYGASGARVAIYKGDMMGAVDYIFGGMTAVFYQSKLVMNISDQTSDQSYITAPQQTAGRGYLMYDCTVTSAEPGTETASTYRAKPGYFGRPWQSNTSEVVFYKTTIETSNNPGFVGNSLINPLGWLNTLSGTSPYMYEYATMEQSGANNSSSRATWATLLANPTLTDGTAINTFNFTKGSDGWDPFPQLIAQDVLATSNTPIKSAVQVMMNGNTIEISNVRTTTTFSVYSMTGALIKSFKTNKNISFNVPIGVYIVTVIADDGIKSVKVKTN